MYKTIVVLKIGQETCCDSSNNGTLVVQHNEFQGTYRALVVGGMLPSGKDEEYFHALEDAMQFVAHHVAKHGVELVEG